MFLQWIGLVADHWCMGKHSLPFVAAPFMSLPLVQLDDVRLRAARMYGMFQRVPSVLLWTFSVLSTCVDALSRAHHQVTPTPKAELPRGRPWCVVLPRQ